MIEQVDTKVDHDKKVDPLDIPENLKRVKAEEKPKTPEEAYKEAVESTATSPAN